MKLSVLGSGSSGNGYILHNEDEALIIECGMPLNNALSKLDNNLRKVVGCLITHSHGDHAKYISQYIQPFYVYATEGTFREKGIQDTFHRYIVSYNHQFNVGNFTILPFRTIHDTEEPCGFLIQHKEIGNLIFATDTRKMLYKFNELHLNHILIECNHAPAMVSQNVINGILPKCVGQRIVDNHMNIERCIDFIKSSCLDNVQEIILLHLSQNNSNPATFMKLIQEASGKAVFIAQKDLEVDLSLGIV